jgi:hypothetical protein
MATQTDKSYLFKKYIKNGGDRTGSNKDGDLQNYPFLRFGWWM